MAPPDTTLLQRMHRGDHQAAAVLWARTSPTLRAYARALLGDRAHADDIVQQVFLHVLALPAPRIAAVLDPLPWLITLTRNAVLNDLRSQRRTSRRERSASPGSSHSAQPDSQEELLAALEQLGDDERELLLLKHVAGLTFDQLALCLTTNRATLATRYRAAISSLRHILARSGAAHAL